MRTIEEIKDKVAQDNGYKNWRRVVIDRVEDDFIDDCIKEAQKEVVNDYDKFMNNMNDFRNHKTFKRDILTEIENQ